MRTFVTSATLAIVTLAAACASTTLISSRPSGANVYLDGQFVGQTPYAMTDRKLIGATTAVHLEAPGYQPLDTSITKNEQINVGLAIGSILLAGIPALWAGEYDPQHAFDLAPGNYLAYYTDKLAFTPGKPTPHVVLASAPPQIAHGTDVARDAATMRATGYVEIGESRFNAPDMPPVASEAEARAVAVQKRAAVVMLYQKPTGTVTNQVPVTVDNPSVTTWTHTDAAGNAVIRSRTTDNYSTEMQAQSEARFDYTATFWVKAGAA